MILEKDILELQDMLRSCGMTLKKKRKHYQSPYKVETAQVKSLADLEMHRYIKKRIGEMRRGTFIISEEDAKKAPAKDIQSLNECFIVDPIDGTASYVNGYPGYVVQLAYLKRGTPFFSMVYAPEFDDMYVAIKDGGTYLNDQLIKVKANSGAIVYIDNNAEPTSKIKKMMLKDSRSTYVECGSIGLKICKIAAGQADIFYKDVQLKDWDLIPPALILQEAGGHIFSLEKNPITYFSNENYSHQGVYAVSNLKFLDNLSYLDHEGKCYDN